ncbi:MAG: AMP-binding protein [Myxococcales bacterium]|nr:AMP-binding protein [Myxococcales bacterium]
MFDPFSLGAKANAAPERTALVTEQGAISYRALADRCSAIGESLARMRGEGAGPVAVRAVNHESTALVLLALIDRGIPFVPLHPRLTDREAEAIVTDARCSLVLRDPEVRALGLLEPARATDPMRTDRDVERESPLAILYTSGTTGTPKGAVLSRRAFFASAAASASNLAWTDDDRWLLCLPLCHVGGLSVLTRCVLATRSAVLLSRFDEALVAETIDAHDVTIASFVPTMLHRLLDAGHEGSLARLRAILLGGAPASTSLLERCARARIRVRTTYGLTEACSQVTTQRDRDPSVVELSSGEPLSGVSVEIRADDGSRCRAGDVGAIHVSGPTLFSGYLHGDKLESGAWFDTGDFGFLDERGRLHVVARRTDLIVTGGENVYPLEVERALSDAPGVEAIMVFGVDDERWGQRVVCAIVADRSRSFDADAFAAAVESRLAPHKRPRGYVLCDALPLTAAGKPDRRAAATQFAGRITAIAKNASTRSTE